MAEPVPRTTHHIGDTHMVHSHTNSVVDRTAIVFASLRRSFAIKSRGFFISPTISGVLSRVFLCLSAATCVLFYTQCLYASWDKKQFQFFENRGVDGNTYYINGWDPSGQEPTLMLMCDSNGLYAAVLNSGFLGKSILGHLNPASVVLEESKTKGFPPLKEIKSVAVDIGTYSAIVHDEFAKEVIKSMPHYNKVNILLGHQKVGELETTGANEAIEKMSSVCRFLH